MSKSNKKTIIETQVVETIDSVVAEQLAALEVVETTPVQQMVEELQQTVVENQQVVEAHQEQISKAAIGRQIFNEELAKGELVRKTVIDRLIKEAHLTKAGAATYFQNMKAKAGLVHHRTV